MGQPAAALARHRKLLRVGWRRAAHGPRPPAAPLAKFMGCAKGQGVTFMLSPILFAFCCIPFIGLTSVGEARFKNMPQNMPQMLPKKKKKTTTNRKKESHLGHVHRRGTLGAGGGRHQEGGGRQGRAAVKATQAHSWSFAWNSFTDSF